MEVSDQLHARATLPARFVCYWTGFNEIWFWMSMLGAFGHRLSV